MEDVINVPDTVLLDKTSGPLLGTTDSDDDGEDDGFMEITDSGMSELSMFGQSDDEDCVDEFSRSFRALIANNLNNSQLTRLTII